MNLVVSDWTGDIGSSGFWSSVLEMETTYHACEQMLSGIGRHLLFYCPAIEEWDI